MKELSDRPGWMQYIIVRSKVYLVEGSLDGVITLEFKAVYHRDLGMWIGSIAPHLLESEGLMSSLENNENLRCEAFVNFP